MQSDLYRKRNRQNGNDPTIISPHVQKQSCGIYGQVQIPQGPSSHAFRRRQTATTGRTAIKKDAGPCPNPDLVLKTIKQDPHCTIGLEVEYRGIAVTLAQGQGRAPTGQAVPENGTCLAKNDLMHLEIEGDPNGQIGLEIVSGRLTKETVNDFLQATAMLRLSLNTHSPIPLSTYAIHDFQF